MTAKLPDLNETESIFASREVAERWHQAKARRGGPANEMMFELANIRAGDRVLDVAAGTGDQTILAAQRVGPTGSVVAVDLSPHMLKIADEAIRNAGLTNVETQIMNAEEIDFDADSFDAVICRMGLMVISNPRTALIGMRRVVKPSGKVVALVLSTAEKNPCRGIPLAVVRRIGSNLTEVSGLRSLFSLSKPDVLEETFRASGFVDVAIHKVPTRASYTSAAEAVRITMDSFPGLRHLMDQLGELERKRAWTEIEHQLSEFEGSNGFEAPGEVLIGVGIK